MSRARADEPDFPLIVGTDRHTPFRASADEPSQPAFVRTHRSRRCSRACADEPNSHRAATSEQRPRVRGSVGVPARARMDRTTRTTSTGSCVGRRASVDGPCRWSLSLRTMVVAPARARMGRNSETERAALARVVPARARMNRRRGDARWSRRCYCRASADGTRPPRQGSALQHGLSRVLVDEPPSSPRCAMMSMKWLPAPARMSRAGWTSPIV